MRHPPEGGQNVLGEDKEDKMCQGRTSSQKEDSCDPCESEEKRGGNVDIS